MMLRAMLVRTPILCNFVHRRCLKSGLSDSLMTPPGNYLTCVSIPMAVKPHVGQIAPSPEMDEKYTPSRPAFWGHVFRAVLSKTRHS